MENASKALIIAGGILLAIMILALLVYMGTAMTDMAESQDRKLAAQQLEEFNKSYLVYNKTRMYGTDVITVVNKAINHNKNIGASETDPYYINVKIKTTDDFKTTGKVINYYLSPDDENYENDLSVDKIKEKMGITEITVALGENSEGYELGKWKDGDLNMDKGIIGFFEQHKVDATKEEKDENGNVLSIYYIYSALTNFKRAIFTCEAMEDTEIDGKRDGRIDTIVFRQVELD